MSMKLDAVDADEERMMGVLKILVTLLVALVGWAPTSAAATPSVETDDCRIEAFAAGVQCVDEHGEHQWQILHPATWGDVEEFKEDAPGLLDDADELTLSDEAHWVENEVFKPQGPVEVGGRVFYAVRADLLELDTERGAVSRRVRFPAAIDEIAPQGDDALQIQLLFFDADWTTERTHHVRYHIDGAPPPQTAWSDPRVSSFAALHDSSGVFHSVVQGDVEDEEKLRWKLGELRGAEDVEDERIHRIIERLQKAYERDPTNPYYPWYIGEMWTHLGDEQRAAQAFQRAAESDAVWRDLLDVSTRLEDAGAHEQGQAAFDRGYDKVREAGIAPERLTSLVRMTMILMPSSGDHAGSSLRAALAAEDSEQVHRLAGRYARLFPYAEGAHRGWSALADWFEERGEAQLADTWRERAQTNLEQGCGMLGPEDRQALMLDRGLWVIFASSLALILLSFLVGLRGGRARRRDIEAAGRDDSNPLPLLKVYDFAGLALVLVAMIAVPIFVVAQSDVIANLADAPLALVDDGLASPVVEDTLESLHPSAQRDELLDLARAEQDAFTQGAHLSDKENLCILIHQAYREDAYQHQLDLVKQGKLYDPIFDILDRDGQWSESDGLDGRHMVRWLLLLIPHAFIFAIGVVIGRFSPQTTRLARLLIPGARLRPSVLTDLVVILFLLGLVSVVGLDVRIQETVMPNFSMY